MKKLTKYQYQCEICKALYDTSEEAIKCELKGKEKPLVELGQTVLYRDDWNGGFGTCFDKLDVIGIHDYGHYIGYLLGDWETKSPKGRIDGNNNFKELCTIVEDPKRLVNNCAEISNCTTETYEKYWEIYPCNCEYRDVMGGKLNLKKIR